MRYIPRYSDTHMYVSRHEQRKSGRCKINVFEAS